MLDAGDHRLDEVWIADDRPLHFPSYVPALRNARRTVPAVVSQSDRQCLRSMLHDAVQAGTPAEGPE